MVLLQMKDPLELFMMRTKFLHGCVFLSRALQLLTIRVSPCSFHSFLKRLVRESWKKNRAQLDTCNFVLVLKSIFFRLS